MTARETAWEIKKGDSLTLLRTLPSASVDAVITDPPYCSGGSSAQARSGDPLKKYLQSDLFSHSFEGDTRDQRSFVLWVSLWLAECLRVAKPGAPLCVFSDWRQLPAVTDALQIAGWVWRGIVPWDKTEQTRPQGGRFRNQAEYIVWGSAGPMPLQRKVGVLPGVVRAPVIVKDKRHPTGKPIEVMRFLARICEPQGLILDPFTGSGSTGLGALLEGRRFLGLEIDAHWRDVAIERLRAVGPPSLALF